MAGRTGSDANRSKDLKSRLALLLAGSFFLQTAQLGIFPIAIAQMLSRNGYDAALIGLFLATMWASVLLFGPFVPGLMRNLSNSLVNGLGYCLSILALFILLMPEVPFIVLISAVLMGAGLIIRWVLCDTLVIRFSSDERRGRFIGFHEALMGLGIGCGPLLFAILDIEEVLGAAIAICVAGAICFLFMDRADERTSDTTVPPHTQGDPDFGMVHLLIGTPILLLALTAALFGGFIESSSIALLPLSFEADGLSLSTAAILVSAFGFGGTVLQPPLGWAADRFGYGFVLALCVVTMLFTCLVAVIGVSISLQLATFFLMGAAAGGFNTLAVIHAGKILPSEKIPLAMTFIAMLYTAGSIIGPVISGVSLQLAPVSGIYWVFVGVSGVMGSALIGWKMFQNRFR